MRKLIRGFMAVVVCLLALGADASKWRDPNTGYTWSYSVSRGEITIRGEADAWGDWNCAVSPKPWGTLKIPTVVGGYPVTSVGEYAFYDCGGLKAVTIPSSVTSIGESAFSGCYRLASVTIPSSVTNIGEHAFEFCSGLTSVTIPSGVTSIGESAFSWCEGLTSVTIPSSVTSIGRYAFEECIGLTAVTIPSSLKNISFAAFSSCSGLTSVTIPTGVTSIGDYAFTGCSGLTSVTIPSGVTSIGEAAFSRCEGLTSVTIPSSVKNIGKDVFYQCNSIRTAQVPGWKCGIDFSTVSSLVISKGTTSIRKEAFSGCESLTSVTIPSSVTSIGESAFSWCNGLMSVAIPLGVTSIGDGAFWGCDGLTSVTIPSGVTSIGDDAFCECESLTSVTIPASVVRIGDSAFSGCSGLTKIVVDAKNSVYKSENGLLLSKDGTSLIRGVRGDVVIPSSVTSIGAHAFYGCYRLTSVTIPSSVTSIGDGAFIWCDGLTSVTIPSSVTSIGDDAFYMCGCLTSVTIPASVTHIGSYTFWESGVLTADFEGLPPEDIGYDVFPGETHIRYNSVYAAAWRSVIAQFEFEYATAYTPRSMMARQYDGQVSSADGRLVATLAVKVAKAKARATTAVTTVALVLADGTKEMLKGGIDLATGAFSAKAKDGRVLALTFGETTFSGTFGGDTVEGALNLFMSKDAADKTAAASALAACGGVYTVALPSVDGWVGLSVAVASKGKTKVTGVLANGVKVSATGQLAVGADWCCVPIIAAKAKLALTLGVKRDGSACRVTGFGGTDGTAPVVGKAGTLTDGAAFRVDADDLAALVGAGFRTDLTPDGTKVAQNGTKWVVAKAGRVKLNKAKDGLDVTGENPAGLKLTYAARTGTFKGSLTVYVLTGTKLAKKKLDVNGVLVNGVGYGTAILKKVGSLPVTVE